MESEFQILDNIERNKTVTQRDIAKSTGMSLGNVNTLIKRLVKKGLLKIEKLNAKTIRYILTPKGLKEKAERTYKYVVASYNYFNDINSKIDAVIGEHSGNEIKQICLFGSKDEIYELLQTKLHHAKIPYELTQTISKLKAAPCSLIIVWHPDYAEILSENNLSYINLLDRI